MKKSTALVSALAVSVTLIDLSVYLDRDEATDSTTRGGPIASEPHDMASAARARTKAMAEDPPPARSGVLTDLIAGRILELTASEVAAFVASRERSAPSKARNSLNFSNLRCNRVFGHYGIHSAPTQESRECVICDFRTTEP